jgi:hypothetical protein
MDNTALVIGRLATMEARQDGSCLRLILIGVDLKVDADWIVAKTKVRPWNQTGRHTSH